MCMSFWVYGVFQGCIIKEIDTAMERGGIYAEDGGGGSEYV